MLFRLCFVFCLFCFCLDCVFCYCDVVRVVFCFRGVNLFRFALLVALLFLCVV